MLPNVSRASSRQRNQDSSTRRQRNSSKLQCEKGKSVYRILEKDKTDLWLESVVVRSDNRSFLVRTSGIDWIEAKGNYVNIHRGQDSSLVRKSMRALEAELDPKRFVRVHRSTIVNVDRIREFQRMFHGEFRIILNGGRQLTLSRDRSGMSFEAGVRHLAWKPFFETLDHQP